MIAMFTYMCVYCPKNTTTLLSEEKEWGRSYEDEGYFVNLELFLREIGRVIREYNVF